MKPTEKQIKTAEKIVELNPKCDGVWLNNKGEFFTKYNLGVGSVKNPEENLVKIEIKPKEILVIDSTEKLINLTVDEIKEAIKSIDNSQLLIDAIQLEAKNDNRKGAKEAIENRIEELEKA
jgi:hypothetical protein